MGTACATVAHPQYTAAYHDSTFENTGCGEQGRSQQRGGVIICQCGGLDCSHWLFGSSGAHGMGEAPQTSCGQLERVSQPRGSRLHDKLWRTRAGSRTSLVCFPGIEGFVKRKFWRMARLRRRRPPDALNCFLKLSVHAALQRSFTRPLPHGAGRRDPGRWAGVGA